MSTVIPRGSCGQESDHVHVDAPYAREVVKCVVMAGSLVRPIRPTVLLCPLPYITWFLIHSIELNFHFKRVLTPKLVLQDDFFLSLFLF